MLTDSTRKYLCKIVGLYDKKTIMSFATVLCLIPENGNGLAAGCQLFYRKIYGYFLQHVLQFPFSCPVEPFLQSQKTSKCLERFLGFHATADSVSVQ